MGRPTNADSLSACEDEIESLQKKLEEAKAKKLELETADNQKLGAMFRSVFGDVLPGKKTERKAFVKDLRVLYDLSIKTDADVSGDTVVLKDVDPELGVSDTDVQTNDKTESSDGPVEPVADQVDLSESDNTQETAPVDDGQADQSTGSTDNDTDNAGVTQDASDDSSESGSQEDLDGSGEEKSSDENAMSEVAVTQESESLDPGSNAQ